MVKYGMEWPEGLHPIQVDLILAKHWRRYQPVLGKSMLDPEDHLLRACRALLPRDVFRISSLTEEHAHDFTHETFCITWGGASCCKSNDYGLFLLLDWGTDPFDTIVLLGSTTKEALKSRSWDSVVRYHSVLTRKDAPILFPGKHSKTGYAIINRDDAEEGSIVATEKTVIRGVAINDGGNLVGAHAKYVRMLVDELAEITNPEAIDTARQNLSKGALDFRFYGLANPVSYVDPSARYAIPDTDEKWASVTVETPCWRSRYGFVRHHDGLKSPCVLDPKLEIEFPFLTTKAQIETARQEEGGEDSPGFWKMVRGFPAPQGVVAGLLLTQTEADRGKATLAPEKDGMMAVAGQPPTVFGIDPAWSEAGDKAIVYPCQLLSLYGRPVLSYLKPIRLAISVSDPLPVLYQLLRQVVELARRMGVPPSRMAVDSSGNQGLGDLIEVEMGPGCLRINSSERASAQGRLKASDPRPPVELVFDSGTESWCTLAEFIRAGQVRGLDGDAIMQLTRRRFATSPKTGVLMNPPRLESKSVYCPRERMGSPNEADAAALAARAIRVLLGVIPGEGLMPMVDQRLIFQRDQGTLDRIAQRGTPRRDEMDREAVDMIDQLISRRSTDYG
jgi:hypothetical protein